MWVLVKVCILFECYASYKECGWNNPKTKGTFVWGLLLCDGSGNAAPKSLFVQKSNFNLVFLIDVAFYFKCLQRYPTTVLCGPVSNETHSSISLLAIRSVANTQCSPLNVVVWMGEHMVVIGWNHWVFNPIRHKHICECGFYREALSPSTRIDRPAVLVLSASSSSGPSPPAHTEGLWRISTPEEGIRGSGASVRGSARGFTFDLLSSTK